MSDSKERAKTDLASLVREFAELERQGALSSESEAAARTWVERLLTVFGWNTSDPRQVKQEYTIRGREARRLREEESVHTRPDYALVVGGERIVYVDAKRFDADLWDDEHVSLQVRSYGWSAGFRVGYACSFREFAIWNCRIKPDGLEEPTVAMVRHVPYTKYEEEFDLLWDYLSREAILSGSLSRRHPDEERPRGTKTLDEDFEEKLSEWRVGLAKSIIRHEETRDPEIISGASQRILDRIVFLRLCEEIGLEPYGEMLSLANDEDGFWPVFMEAHEKRYRTVYDGLLFPAKEEEDPTNVEHHLRQWWLKGEIFKTIARGLYHPQPYQFDVVPIELLGGVYERFLGKRLRITGSKVEEEFKPEYQRTKGAVYTPAWVVRRVVERTLAPLIDGATPDDILGLRVLDPACGSGGFLLGVFDFLEEAILEWARAHPTNRRLGNLVARDADGLRLTVDTSRRIITGCLHGVDIDPNAVEVARMSLALRHVERFAADLPETPRDVLAGIGRNVRQGNSLVGPDIAGLGLEPDRVRRTMPFSWKDRVVGFGNVMDEGGFHAVVGNPPYVEVKRYREWMPEMYRYLKESGVYVTTAQGKTDISVPFMECAVRHLRPGGRMGFIIQNRFFKTDYGEAARRWLRQGRLLEAVEDFRDLQVFAGRTTYTAIVVLKRESRSFEYRSYADLAAARADEPAMKARIRADQLDDAPWSLDEPDLLEVHRALAKRHGTIGDHSPLQICVGLQTLYGKVYQFEAEEVTTRRVRGTSGLGEHVEVERGAVRPLCRNRGFYPFRTDNADAWVIFPYDVNGESATEIKWTDFQRRYPLAAAYLKSNRKAIRDAVEAPEGRNRWHLYLYPKNLVQQTRPKVLFPMTIEDTAASVDRDGDVYQDNVNVNSVSVNGADIDLYAIAAVFNSTVFGALARLKAGLNDAGWRKFNRQFAELAPFPFRALKSGPRAARLAGVGALIEQHQGELRKAAGEGQIASVRGTLTALWAELDEIVEALYGLTADQKNVLDRYPRKVDRVDLALRARNFVATENGDEDE
ncbi:MAG: N-6 DNA methylase [Planctomycetes bacterium]|nr:N-6 DNA methylase [Planctomycetota bacterium]